MTEFNEVILLKYGELILKGLNKPYFENVLLRDIKERIVKFGDFSVTKAQSTIFVVPEDTKAKSNIDRAYNETKKIFGISSCCKAAVVEKDMEKILCLVPEYASEALMNAKTFKVESKRADKLFPLESTEISRECGGAILQKFHHLKVDVKNPEVEVRVEIRDKAAYVHCGSEPGAGGMPCGSGGKVLLLLSGGIDSPVAGYEIAKRGVKIEALHFESYPYTSVQAREKVVELASIMTDFCGDIDMNIVSVTHIQEVLRDTCREDYFTLLLRRFMMRIAEKIALMYKSGAIITGESLGQVASQTLEAITVTNETVKTIPVLRPLIASDKTDIIKTARKIGTYDTSILPYEDCCTVFTPKHPCTKPLLSKILAEEAKLDVDALINEAIESRTHLRLERN